MTIGPVQAAYRMQMALKWEQIFFNFTHIE